MSAASGMVFLTSAGGSFHARVLAARLDAEGIVAELRGSSEGPYPVFSAVSVFVRADQLDLAREVLLADAVDAAFDEIDEPERVDGRTLVRRRQRLVVTCFVVGLLVVVGLLAAMGVS